MHPHNPPPEFPRQGGPLKLALCAQHESGTSKPLKAPFSSRGDMPAAIPGQREEWTETDSRSPVPQSPWTTSSYLFPMLGWSQLQVDGCSQPLVIPTLTQQDLLEKSLCRCMRPKQIPVVPGGGRAAHSCPPRFGRLLYHCLVGRKLSAPCTYSYPLSLGASRSQGQ